MIWAALVAALAGEPAEVEAMAGRLIGHTIEISEDHRTLTIVDVAGEGAPIVGVVERDGEHLVLVSGEDRLRLEGPLARPRIAGPGYTIWVTGSVAEGSIRAKRLGILRRP